MTKEGRGNNFDLLRLFAALQVMTGHFAAVFSISFPAAVSWFLAQFQGVAVFFVISGFLVTRSYLDRPNLGGYALRRALRIYPALWVHFVFLLILFALAGALYSADWLNGRFWIWIAAAAVTGSNHHAGVVSQFWFHFDQSTFYPFFPSGVLWTIPVELGFYILTPIVFAGWLRRRGLLGFSLILWMIASVAAAWVTRRIIPDHIAEPSTQLWISSPGPYFWIYLLGATCALYWQRISWLFEGKALYWLSAHLGFATFDLLVNHSSIIGYRIPSLITFFRVPLMAGTIIALAFTCKRAVEVLRGNDISYGLYLYHLPVVFTFHFAGYNGWPAVFGASGISIALATTSWLLIERPALRLKRTRGADRLATGYELKLR